MKNIVKISCVIIATCLTISCDIGGNGNGDGDERNIILSLSVSELTPCSMVLNWTSAPVDTNYSVYVEGDGKSFGSAGHIFSDHIEGLIPETNYCAKVIAAHVERGPWGGYWKYIGESNEICLVTPPDTTNPSPPTRFNVISTQDEITLNWMDGTDECGPLEYRIFRDGNIYYDTGGPTREYIDTNLNPNTSYEYQIATLDAGGNESEKTLKAYVSTEWPSILQTVTSLEDFGLPSIALDLEGKAHISYYDSINGYIMYATNAFGNWDIAIIDETVQNQYGHTSLAIDSNNHAHIAYNIGTTSLEYATNKSGDWVITTIEAGWVGLTPSLAIDSQDNIHISYKDYQNGNIKYATNASGAWITEIIYDMDYGWNAVSNTSLALDSSDDIHVSYYDNIRSSLSYATNKSGAWVTTILDNYGDVGESSSLAIDATDKLHISYYGQSLRNLIYITNVSGIWIKRSIDSGGKFNSIALDSFGKVHIVYDSNFSLMYATNSSGEWVKHEIAPLTRGGNSITTDSSNRIHIFSKQGTDAVYSIYSVY